MEWQCVLPGPLLGALRASAAIPSKRAGVAITALLQAMRRTPSRQLRLGRVALRHGDYGVVVSHVRVSRSRIGAHGPDVAEELIRGRRPFASPEGCS